MTILTWLRGWVSRPPLQRLRDRADERLRQRRQYQGYFGLDDDGSGR